jgi:hypothetical protein
MDETQLRARAEAMCAALVAGDVGKATEDFSKELRQNLGEVVALLPLPRPRERSNRSIAAAARASRSC